MKEKSYKNEDTEVTMKSINKGISTEQTNRKTAVFRIGARGKV